MKIRQVYWHINAHEHMAEDHFKFCPLCGEQMVQQFIDNRLRMICPQCDFVHFRNPSPAISLVILNEGQILLGKRSNDPGKGRWATPSGFIEFNEDFLTTAVREAKEETNLDIEIAEILDVTDSFFPPEHHFLNIYLLARVIGGELCAGDDAEDIQWYPLEGPLPEMAFQEDIDLIAHLCEMQAASQDTPTE